MVKLDSKKAKDIKKLALGGLVLGAFTVPVFRSGGRTGLTFVGWLVNHTIFGPPVEYVPEEDYARELEGVEMPKQLPSRSQLEGAKAYYQISEPSARELLSYPSEVQIATRESKEVRGLMALSSISITAPSSAVEGDRVSVSARVTNISADSYPFRVKLYAVRDIYAVPAPGDLLDTFEEIIGSGAYKTISGSFTMPAWDTIILVMVHRFIDYWDYDNYSTKVVSLEEIAEVVPCEITITAPDSVAQGETVNTSVKIKNVSAYNYSYKIEIYAVPDLFPDFRIGTIEKNINSGSTFTAYGSFTMPASNTTVFVWVERWDVDHWVYDNSASKIVSFEAILYKGTISKKELEYDETRGIIPVY